MSHPVELLDAIEAMLRARYPLSRYRYVREAPLMGDRHYQPDIQVFTFAGALQCVVEVGYTRPEKLRHYEGLAIPDIRWYAKDGRLVYSFSPLGITTSPLRLPAPPTAQWRNLICDAFECPALARVIWRVQERAERIRRARGRGAALRYLASLRRAERGMKGYSGVLWEHEVWGSKDITALVDGDAHEAQLEILQGHHDVTSWAFTEGRYGVVVWYCDMCRAAGVASPEDGPAWWPDTWREFQVDATKQAAQVRRYYDEQRLRLIRVFQEIDAAAEVAKLLPMPTTLEGIAEWVTAQFGVTLDMHCVQPVLWLGGEVAA